MSVSYIWHGFLILIGFFIVLPGYAQNARHVDSVENVLTRTNDPEKKVDLLLHLSSVHDFSDPQKALAYAKQASDFALKSSYKKGYCISLIREAKVYYVLSDLKNAMECADEAKEIAESLDLKLELAVALDAIGFIYYEIGEENKSSDYFFSSLKIYENLKDKKGIGQSLCRIGTLYYNQKDNAKAADYYTRSMNIAKELKNEEGIASNLSNLATVYTAEHDYTRALKNYFEALKINQESGNAQLEGSNYLNIGNLYLKLGELDSASENVQKALLIFTRLGNQVRIAKAQLAKGEILLAGKQYDQSLGIAKKALETSLDNGYKEIISSAAGLLHKVFLVKQDSVKAYYYSRIEEQWNDSLFLGEKQKTLARLELQYQFEKKEHQNKIIQQRRIFFIVLLSVLVVFSIIVIFLVRSHYRLKDKKTSLEKKNLEMDLDYKKKELTLNVMSLMKKNEMLSGITKKIIQIEKESEQEETRKALKKVARELQKSTEEEILKEFSMRFKEVHNDFYDTLLKKFPALTPSELKLSAFLRLNMTTKEIAELTGQQITTLENARYRLRQKLGITSSDVNLVTFLAQI